jgi:hypothetical protein
MSSSKTLAAAKPSQASHTLLQVGQQLAAKPYHLIPGREETQSKAAPRSCCSEQQPSVR